MTSKEQKIVEDNLNLVRYVINKIYCGNEDYFDLGVIGLIKGVKSFKEEKGYHLSTYLVACIRNEIAYAHRADKNPRDTLSIDYENNDVQFVNIVSNDELIEDSLVKKEELHVLKKALHQLNKLERHVIINYYGLFNHDKMKLKEIAYKLGVNPNFISKVHIKALKKLKIYMEEGKL